MQKIVDTHCHYNLEPILSNSESLLRSAVEKGVTQSICVGTSIKTSQIAIELAKNNVHLFATCGIHPGLCQRLEDHQQNQSYIQNLIDNLDTLISNNTITNKVVAIGEIGLDFYRLKQKGQKRERIEHLQVLLLEKQLELAVKYQLPIILHVRDQKDRNTKNTAYWKTYEIVSAFFASQKQLPVILHCASGPLEYIEKFLEIGAYIGIAGNITYDSATELRKILEVTPPERLLLETDAPYLTPAGIHHDFCRPENITTTAEYLVSQYKINLDIILENTYRVFPSLQSKSR